MSHTCVYRRIVAMSELEGIIASSSRGRKVFRIWCTTESKYVTTDAYMDEPPASCPNDDTHVVDVDSAAAVAREPPVAVPGLDALARHVLTRPGLRTISSATISVRKGTTFERVAAFSWTVSRPLLSVILRGQCFTNKLKGDETLELAVVEVDTNATVGTTTTGIVTGSVQTVWVDVGAPGQAVVEVSTDRPVLANFELLATAGADFAIESVEAWG